MSETFAAQANANVLYRADDKTVQNLKSMRENLNKVCRQYVNRYVQVETMDGHVLTGRIANVDNGILYLAIPVSPMNRQFFYPYGYNEMILTLVLYELLVISLLS